MSYILDALRRANSERERGTVPTLHADPGPADLSGDDEESERGAARRLPWTVWLATGIALVTAVVVALYRPAARPPAPQPSPVLPAPPAPQTLTPTPAATVVLDAAPAPATPAPAVAPPPKPIASPPAVTPPAAAAIPSQAELPDAIRRQLPALTSGGAMYSDAPASRMLILNGQVLREGDKLTPDLVLEEIRLKGAVLNFKGQRFTISY